MKSIYTKFKKTIHFSMIAAGFAILAGFVVKSTRTTPLNAVVFVNPVNNEYYSPPCVPKRDQSTLIKMSVSDARGLKYKINNDCVKANGFVQKGRSLSGKMFQKIGVLSPLDSRWNSDGSWRW